MGLNISRGNMYDFVSHTFNTVKGECPHGCSYCFCKRWGKQAPLHFDERELKTDLGSGNFIFVGSSCDMWAQNIPTEWICRTLDKCCESENQYLFQTKNPGRFEYYEYRIPDKSILCTTIETNRMTIYDKSLPTQQERGEALIRLKFMPFRFFITIEPVMDFDMPDFAIMLKRISPEQINIGADSGNNNLPEPSAEKVLALIEELSKFTKVVQKPNLERLLKGSLK